MVAEDSRTPDPSSFYRLNEEIALELARLERAGALDRLLGLIGDADVELLVTSVRPREGLEELIGGLRPLRPGAEAAAPGGSGGARRTLSPDSGEGPTGCSRSDAGDAALAQVRAELCAARGGWDHEGFLAARSRFTVSTPEGAAEVYMPDHICPSCWNAEGNRIESCSRNCGACGFGW